MLNRRSFFRRFAGVIAGVAAAPAVAKAIAAEPAAEAVPGEMVIDAWHGRSPCAPYLGGEVSFPGVTLDGGPLVVQERWIPTSMTVSESFPFGTPR